MPIYQTTGTLTGTIERDNVQAAQDYLTSDDMTQYLDEPLQSKIERIQWSLHNDGHSYHVEAIARQELSEAELKELASWVSGQNSDGLGESFEQQEFAELQGDCGVCESCIDGYSCDGDGDSSMISFDWETNDSTFVRV